jgi:hypothetical protein
MPTARRGITEWAYIVDLDQNTLQVMNTSSRPSPQGLVWHRSSPSSDFLTFATSSHGEGIHGRIVKTKAFRRLHEEYEEEEDKGEKKRSTRKKELVTLTWETPTIQLKQTNDQQYIVGCGRWSEIISRHFPICVFNDTKACSYKILNQAFKVVNHDTRCRRNATDLLLMEIL